MPDKDRQTAVWNILENLRNLDGLKQLFWEELNYERENRPLSPRQWPEIARQPLAEDPILFASGGEDSAFHVVYCRLESDKLLRGHERPIVNCLTREHPYALFVFSNKARSDWHFLNVKYDEEADKRRLLRRITVRPGEGLRTATERMQMLDLAAIPRDLFGLPPLVIQQRHDDAFDVEKVSKDFYREIANWYFWALKHVKFPKDAPKEADGHDHISVIRLITRLIFCWFIREKGLIPDLLFDEAKLAEMLDGFAPRKKQNKDSVFYRAILQNLFFATLNTEMDQRGWRRADQNFMAHCLYRHKACFRDPKAGLDWFKDIPFLNGGLFECLDRDLGAGVADRYVRVDGFSDRDDCQPTVPDFLFFGSEQDVDLSDDYGDNKFRSVRVRGLITTLNRYKFTIEENTPLDQEVALDPELCGKVFENLLAAYNPETGTTARKATGSFYTPREIVDYMVDESLVAYLNGKLTPEHTETTESRLRPLLAYDGETPDFNEAETEALIAAIDDLKALDPAVGSGAFPMGILHKLVHVLGKLDPDNERWKAKQIAKLDDAVMREDAERVFRENYDDYGRKLYLIENCIYGVDIQPIAVQIAKMRFFISLIVDQKVNPKAPNRGVRALPNLETKFVAANTLIGIDRPKQKMFRNPEIDKKEAELRKVREKHFTARTLKSKAKCREDDKRLRDEIAELLKKDGWDNPTAKRLAAWDPYDQNASAGFFDSEWMFGVTKGFDVVIGNPPYGFRNVLSAEEKSYFRKVEGIKFPSGDIAELFVIKCCSRLVANRGCLTFIIPKKSLYGESWANVRRLWLSQSLRCLMDASQAFENVLLEQVAFLMGTEPGGSPRIAVGGLDSRAALVVAFGTFSSEDIFPLPKRCAQIYRGLCPRPLLAKIAKQSLPDSGQFLKAEIGISNITSHLTFDAKGNHPCLKGIDIVRYGLKPERRYLTGSVARPYVQAYAHEKLIAQEIVAHIQNPEPHISIAIVFDRDGKLFNDTCVEINILDERLDPMFVMGYLQSKFVAWYAYNFIYNRAVRTMHFINYYVTQIPLPKAAIVNQHSQEPVIHVVRSILAAKAPYPTADTLALERKVDEHVYRLYDLTAEEIDLVDGTGE